jgi:putative PIN family toxin of toxin-antitoxin system
MVLDSNVLLAGLGSLGLCEVVLEVCLVNHTLVLSESILGEVQRNLVKFNVPKELAERGISGLRSNGTIVTPAPVPPGACRDPGDLAILGTALAGRADCLVTGDKDLLALRRFRGIDILSPRAFHDRLG